LARFLSNTTNANKFNALWGRLKKKLTLKPKYIQTPAIDGIK